MAPTRLLPNGAKGLLLAANGTPPCWALLQSQHRGLDWRRCDHRGQDFILQAQAPDLLS